MAIHIITDLPTFRIMVDITDNLVNIQSYVLINKVWTDASGITLNNKEFEKIYNLRKSK